MYEPFVSHRTHKIDAKGRISIPANMRSALGAEFIVSRGTGKCLALYPMDEWRKLMEKIESANESDKQILEFFYCADAEKMSLDGQGRLLLTDILRAKVNLLNESQAEVFGRNKTIQIWNCELFKQKLESITEEAVISIMDKLGN